MKAKNDSSLTIPNGPSLLSGEEEITEDRGSVDGPQELFEHVAAYCLYQTNPIVIETSNSLLFAFQCIELVDLQTRDSYHFVCGLVGCGIISMQNCYAMCLNSSLVCDYL